MTSIEARQFTKEQIADYLDGTMDGDELFEFETEIFSNLDLEKEVAEEVLNRMRKERTRRAIGVENTNSSLYETRNSSSKGNSSWFKKYFNFFSSN